LEVLNTLERTNPSQVHALNHKCTETFSIFVLTRMKTTYNQSIIYRNWECN
jgi:hypothetical protein